jgi:hypothetical protein
MPYKAGTLLGNWFEQRLEPSNSGSFSGLKLPTSFAHSYKTSSSEMTKEIAASAPPARFKAPSENWLTGGTDPLSPKQRYQSVNAAAFVDPKTAHSPRKSPQPSMTGSALQEYRKKWTRGDPDRFQ